MIKLASTHEVYCPDCLGTGATRQRITYSTRTQLDGMPTIEPSTGAVIPCPRCNGRKTVTVSSKPDRENPAPHNGPKP